VRKAARPVRSPNSVVSAVFSSGMAAGAEKAAMEAFLCC
jgi:hypothetical protein